MNYSRVYDNFISDRRKKEPYIDGYFETHHIKPRCMGGGNEKANLIRLSAGDHLFAHRLLAKIHESTKHAFKMNGSVIIMCRKLAHAGGLGHQDRITKSALRRYTESAKVAKALYRDGKSHPSVDPIKYTFVNVDGRTFVGLRNEFCDEFNVKISTVSSLARGSTAQTKCGWSIPGMQDGTSDVYKESKKWREENSTKRYTFHTFFGTPYSGTIQGFIRLVGLSVDEVMEIVKGRKQVKGWYIM